jgi:hypothetical protein
MRYPGAQVSAVIAAPIEEVWALVSDPKRHAEIAGTGEVNDVSIVGDGPVGLGTVFESQQHVRGMRYVTANKVVRYDRPFSFAWRIGARYAPGIAQIYGFQLAPADGGTLVQNGMAAAIAAPAFFPFSLLHEDVGRREADGMRPTLANIARALGAPPPSSLSERHEPPPELVGLMPPTLLQGAGILGLGGLVALGLWMRQRD